jgi:ribonuclease HI
MELRVYCDGYCSPDQLTGIGIYLNKGNIYNTSSRLMPEGFRQSKGVAKFVAVIYTLQIIPDDRPIQIITDSGYALYACTWYELWKQRQNPADLESMELFRTFDNLFNARRHRVIMVQGRGHPILEKATMKACLGATQTTHMIMGLGDGLTCRTKMTFSASDSNN